MPDSHEETGGRSAGQPALSLVIPAYNEAPGIAEPLLAACDFLAAQPYSAEVIVVDDGSEDGTFEVVRGTARRSRVPLRAFRYPSNAGKGHALKYGVARATGERILFTDADLATPIEEAEVLLACLDAGADVVIGSRKMPGARLLVHQPWYREWLGRGYTWLTRHLIRELSDVSDVTCGFKAFTGDAGHDIFARMRIYDWGFDAELLLLARHLGYRLEQVPVRWSDRAGSKVRLRRDAMRALEGLVRIRMNLARGTYRTHAPTLTSAETWEWEPVGREAVPTSVL